MRPSPARSPSALSTDGIWSIAPSPRGAGPLPGKFFSDGLLADLADPVVSERDRTRFPSQNASNNPSNRSQSDLRAENRCLKAERSKPGFAA